MPGSARLRYQAGAVERVGQPFHAPAGRALANPGAEDEPIVLGQKNMRPLVAKVFALRNQIKHFVEQVVQFQRGSHRARYLGNGRQLLGPAAFGSINLRFENGEGQLLGQRLEDQEHGFVEDRPAPALHVQHTQHPLVNFNRQSNLGLRVGRQPQVRHVAWIFGQVLDDDGDSERGGLTDGAIADF